MTKAEFKQKAVLVLKKVTTYIAIVAALAVGYYVGRWKKYNESQVSDVTNPYKHVHTDTQISIAVNENEELLLIDKSTGNYVMYSDQVGRTIFDMYANRMYQQAVGNE